MTKAHPGRDLAQDTVAALQTPNDILLLSEDEMKQLGYWVVDTVVAHVLGMDERGPVETLDAASLEAALGGPLPAERSTAQPHLATLAEVAARYQQHAEHARYFARIPSPASFPGILADWLSVGMQTVASTWSGSAGPTTVELVACKWLAQALGLGTTWEGLLTSGGSMANMTGIVAARAEVGEGAIYISEQTHASIRRCLPVIGFEPRAIRVVATDNEFRMDALSLRIAVERDLETGIRPAVVVATAGTTNTGAVDDLAALSAVCKEHAMWLHVDAAYAGSAAICRRGREQLLGLVHADSIVVDPHKWLFQPYDISCLFVKDVGSLERTFSMNPEYLADVSGGHVDLCNRGFELSRRGRAFKLWLTLRTYGVETLALAVDRGIALAEFAQFSVERSQHLSTFTPAQLGVVTFGAKELSPSGHKQVVDHLMQDAGIAIGTTVLNGRTVFRLCTINPRTTTDDIDETVRLIDSLVHHQYEMARSVNVDRAASRRPSVCTPEDMTNSPRDI